MVPTNSATTSSNWASEWQSVINEVEIDFSNDNGEHYLPVNHIASVPLVPSTLTWTPNPSQTASNCRLRFRYHNLIASSRYCNVETEPFQVVGGSVAAQEYITSHEYLYEARKLRPDLDTGEKDRYYSSEK